MKYYAVTEDPNELLHYGVKGMKWGQHIFGKERSPGYHRALGKLRASAKKVGSAIRNSSQQRAMAKEQKLQNKYANAIAKAQKRIQMNENLHNLDQLKSYERNMTSQFKTEQKMNKRIDRAAAKQERKYAKSEAKMDKYIQQAREGKLKYSQLSDEQVQHVMNRLNAERGARMLSGTEKTWRQQKKEAFRQGKLQGITRGTAAAMEELARAGTVYGIQNFMNRRKMNAVAKQEGKEQKIRDRARNKKTHRDITQEVKEEAFEARVREGEGVIRRNLLKLPGAASQAKHLKEIEDKNHERIRVQKLQDRINDEMYLENNAEYQKMLSKQRERKRLQDIQEQSDTDTEKKWQKYLDTKGLNDAEARKLAGYSDEAISRSSNKEANEQRRAIMAKDERDTQDAAYGIAVKEAQRRINIEAAEERNAKREEKYARDMSKYKEDQQYDKEQQDKYEAKVDKYNQAMSNYEDRLHIWNSNPAVRANNEKPKPPKMPEEPEYRKTKKPKRKDYGFEDIDYAPLSIVPSRSEYQSLRELGINVPMFNNSGNGKKNKNKGGK